MQNVVGPTLVAMATKFGLGAEIQSPTGLSSLPLASDTMLVGSVMDGHCVNFVSVCCCYAELTWN